MRTDERADNFIPASDKLWQTAETPFVAVYDVLGVPLEVATNSETVAEMAADVFASEPAAATSYRGMGVPARLLVDSQMRLRVFVHDVPDDPEAPLITRAQAGRLFQWRGGSLGFADRPGGFATAFLTPRMVADRQMTQVVFLEHLGMFIVCRDRPVTLHSAGVAHAGRCVLLTGAQGAGKSTLAYACVREGFGLLAEDIVFGAAPSDAVDPQYWGNSRYMHLLPDAVRFFPELTDIRAVQQTTGERKLRLKVDDVRSGAALYHQQIWGVCSVGRKSGASLISAGDPGRISESLTTFKGDPPLDRKAMATAAERLASGRIAHLDVGSDPVEAVGVLRRWIEEG